MRRRIAISLLVPLMTIPLLGGCAVAVDQAAIPAPTDPGQTEIPATPASSETPEREGVPGYPLGEFPPIPLFVMPDLSMLDTAMSGFSVKVRDKFPTVPGVTIRPARCDKGGTVQTDDGALLFYGDGSGTYTTGDGQVINHGDGSGTYTINGKTVVVHGDGSGTYEDGKVSVASYGDGSGTYEDGKVSVVLHGNGAGTYESGGASIVVFAGGGGTYTNGSVSIVNYGNGSGTYNDGTISITNHGNHTGDYSNSATGEEFDITPEPIAPVATLGKFPSMGTLKPIKSCGTRITIDDAVLFDFNKDTLRPSAKETMAKLATLFTELKISKATISGHTDAIGTDEYNQGLSERRASSVKQALLGLGVSTNLQAIGYGETKPVAPNTIDGHDNPAGRQANRRVEIFIPNGG